MHDTHSPPPYSPVSHSSGRRQSLIEATISTIAECGLSGLTLSKVAGRAGMTAGSVNFHFQSKEALLLETLTSVSEEFARRVDQAVADAGDDPADQLQALVSACFDPSLTAPGKIAVWYAFLSESQAREEYNRICGHRDEAFGTTVRMLCRRILEQAPQRCSRNADALARALVGLIDQLWQDMLFSETASERRSARTTCDSYLSSIFPWAFGRRDTHSSAKDIPELAPVERNGVVYTLPAWTYVSQEFFELEADIIFRSSWQLVGHLSQIPDPGDYLTFNLLTERALVIRGKDGRVRGFHNVCAHRAHAVVQGRSGHCKGYLQCPYHGWTYQLDGACRAVSMPDSFDTVEKQKLGLKAVDIEIFQGFIFLRFDSRGPSVAERMAPYNEELSHYRLEKMVPCGDLWEEVHNIDWKNVVDNYVEDYHFPTGHPGLSALMQRDYQREALPSGVMRLSHHMRDKPLKGWSVERYHQVLPEFSHLPEDMRRRWSYFGLFPSVFFDCYPESMDFFQVLPMGPGKVKLRSQTYTLPGGPRETQAAEFLSTRINTQVQAEDNELTRSVQQGLKSSAYQLGILSSKEVVVRGFHDWIRAQLPVSRLLRAPPVGTAGDFNKRLADFGDPDEQGRAQS